MSKPKITIVILLALAVAAGVWGWRVGWFSSESSAGVGRQYAKAATTSVSQLKAKDYAGSYSELSATDKAVVSEDEWTRRCKEVEAIAGEIKDYEVLGSRYLDAGKTIVAVDVQVEFGKVSRPRRSTLYYEMKDGKPVQTMLWGRHITAAGEVQ